MSSRRLMAMPPVLLGLVGLFFAIVAGISQEPVCRAGALARPAAQKGRKLFDRQFCGSCHSLDNNPGVGPSLQGVGARLTREEIRKQLLEPRDQMPKAVENLTTAELEELLEFLADLK